MFIVTMPTERYWLVPFLLLLLLLLIPPPTCLFFVVCFWFLFNARQFSLFAEQQQQQQPHQSVLASRAYKNKQINTAKVSLLHHTRPRNFCNLPVPL